MPSTLQVCGADGCENVPGARFRDTGYCGKHQGLLEDSSDDSEDADSSDDDEIEALTAQAGELRISGRREYSVHRTKVADMCGGVVGSSPDRCNGGWLLKWKTETNSQEPRCGIYNCGVDASCGAHVWLKGQTSDRYHYIIPACTHHNSSIYNAHDGWHRVRAMKVLRIDCNCPHERLSADRHRA